MFFALDLPPQAVERVEIAAHSMLGGERLDAPVAHRSAALGSVSSFRAWPCACRTAVAPVEANLRRAFLDLVGRSRTGKANVTPAGESAIL